METVRTLVVQCDDNDPPGRLADWLIDAGAAIDLVRPDRDPLTANPRDYAAIVVLGGSPSAYDTTLPWLVDIRRLLASAVSADVATLGVCLGGQLLALAAGGAVEPGADGPEVGCGLVAKRDLGWADPLFADLPLMPDVIQWHADAITRLPPGAAHLAAATRYPNQAFRVGRRAYGLQFHIETTPEIVAAWVGNNPGEAATARPGDFDAERQEQVHADIEETWRPFIGRFLALARGDLVPVEPDRPTLPMA